jgi:SAM-dependent methyltransferase
MLPLTRKEKRTMADTGKLTDRADVREIVRQKYGAAALTVLQGQGAACCGGGGKSCCGDDAVTGGLYDQTEATSIPEAALLASLGCGNPTALAALRPGEVVLDLGSGGGIDVLLAARRVGPTGFVYGLDMTDEMLALAEKNRAEAGATNARFLKGQIEAIPLPDASVDVVISNCVINLSADKDAVLKEAFRVLKPGGRLAISDVVTRGAIPDEVRRSMLAWVGCVAGALRDYDYVAKLARAGFEDIDLDPTRVYDVEDARGFLGDQGLDVDAVAGQVAGKVMSAFVRAVKPVQAACCAPGCCG